METYLLGPTLELLSRPAGPEEGTLTLLTSEELSHTLSLPGLESVLPHTPPARDARVCKAEMRGDCLCGTVFTPRKTKDGQPIAFGYLLTGRHMVLCDDCGAARSLIARLAKDNKHWPDNGPGRIFYELLELLIVKDHHHLEEMEDRLSQLEDDILSGALDRFSAPITALRNEAMNWYRYHSQLGDMACELEEDESGFFSEHERRLFHLVVKRLGRLRDEDQLLREYCLQVRELFQAQVDIRQNRIMQILTVVTTLCLPLSLVAGWYGMNFVGMPELGWKYGYPAVIAVSVLIVIISLWIMKKKKFW